MLPLVSKTAPLLSAVLGTPFAKVAMVLLGQAFGVNSNNADDIRAAILKDPEAGIKLKTIEYEHAEMLAKISSKDYMTEVEDRKDARKNGVLYKDFLRHMAFIVTGGFFGALILLFSPLSINNESRELLSMLVGMLVSKWQTIIDFFYGSSRSRHQKS